MKNWKRVIQIADCAINLLIILCFLPPLLYGIYAIWDSNQVYQQADSSLYETYKPSEATLSFEELQKINSEVFGWLTIEGTHIDYPLVQAANNSKYVNTDVKGEFSLSGSIFLDCRNQKNFSDTNHIIYGHHMDKEAMFGELQYFEKQSYFEKHKYEEIYYEGQWHKIEFFAFLNVDAYDSVIYNPYINGENERLNYLNYIREYAQHFRELPFQSEERYVVLSTCTSSSTNGRHVLVGRISEVIKTEEKK